MVVSTKITDRSTDTLADRIYYSYFSKCDTNDIITGGNLWYDLTDHPVMRDSIAC